MTSKIRTILFDLDGTFADTAPDLAYALNSLRAERGESPLPYEAVRAEASHGSQALIGLSFNAEPGAAEYEPLKQRFLELYAANLCRETRLFPGMRELLGALSGRGINWGIVTNKPAFLTDPLVKALGMSDLAATVISGDSTGNRKPHPEPMLQACREAGCEPEQCLYVGDAERDIHAGKHAGMKTLVALFGYINPHDKPETWGADDMIRSPMEILDWIDARLR